jgi:hypothetical protein
MPISLLNAGASHVFKKAFIKSSFSLSLAKNGNGCSYMKGEKKRAEIM